MFDSKPWEGSDWAEINEISLFSKGLLSTGIILLQKEVCKPGTLKVLSIIIMPKSEEGKVDQEDGGWTHIKQSSNLAGGAC